MTRLRDIAIPALAPASNCASPFTSASFARVSYYTYYFGSFSGRYA